MMPAARTGPAGILLFLLLAATPPLPLSAQVTSPGADTIPRFDSIAPQPLPEEPEAAARLPAPPQEEVTDDTELVDKLRGLWLTARQDGILVEGRKDPEGLSIENLPLLDTPEVRASLATRLGGPVTLKRLNELVREIIAIYRDNDLPVVDVLIPEQDVTTGIVQILVLEGRVEDLRAEGNRWFSDRLILRPLRLQRGGRILATPLVEDLNFLNRNPFREVDVYFSPGDTPGFTDVVIKTRDRFPVRFYAGYEDTGNDITAEERGFAGFNWGNAFGLGHTLNYQFTASPDTTALRSHAGSYDIPVLRDHRLSFFASYAQADAGVTGAGIPGLATEGTSIQAGFRYRHQLPGSGAGFRHNGILGLDFRRVDNDLFSGALTLNAELTEVLHPALGYALEWNDPLGGTVRADLTGFFSPGGAGIRNDKDSFEASRRFADPSYTYARGSLERRQPLPAGFEFAARLSGQVADTNLLSTEQFGIGGWNTVRGYTEFELRGDQGWFTNLELYTPPIPLARLFRWEGKQAEVRFLGFWDYGQVANVTLLPGENPDGELSSAGAGMRLFLDRHFSARMDYGFQLLDSGFNQRFDSRIHLGLVFSY